MLVAGFDKGPREQHDLKYQKAQLMCSALPQRARVQNKTCVRLLVARQPSTQNVHLCPRLGLGEDSQRPTIGAARERSPPAAYRAGVACRSTSAAATSVSDALKVKSLVSTHALNAGVALEHVHVMRCARSATPGTTIALCVVRFCEGIVCCVHSMCVV